MKACSNDLRERVAAAFAAPGATQTAVAARFCGSVSIVEKLCQRQRASGPVAALPHRSGPAPLLAVAARAAAGAYLRQQPDATLDELRVWVAALGGPAHDGAGRAGVGLAEKKSVHAVSEIRS